MAGAKTPSVQVFFCGRDIWTKKLSLFLTTVNKQNYWNCSSTSTHPRTLTLLLGLSPYNELQQLPDIVDFHLAHDLGAKGIRVNAISAGPIRTLAAAGISGFKDMLHYVSERAPLKRNIDAEEVGKTALYLCSDWGSAVTGEVIHVDAGYNIMGM